MKSRLLSHSNAIERLERTLSVSGYHFVKSDAELPLHEIGGQWIEQAPGVDRSRTSSFGPLTSPSHNRIFTAASGLGHDLRPPINPSNSLEEDPEGSSNTSEVEDSCLDNSSQDSFSGHHGPHTLPIDNGARRSVDSPAFTCDRPRIPSISVTSPTSSHCRLRTALLNSPGRLHTIPNKSPGPTLGRSNVVRSFPQNGYNTPRSPTEVNRSLVISRRPEHNTKSSLAKDIISKMPRTFSPPRLERIPSRCPPLSNLTEAHRSSSSHALSAVASVGSGSQLSVNRPPSAAPALRRMSSDSCVERTFASQKSVSQPHSPDYQHRRSSMPISPCRLPMKKRKFDWDQVTSEDFQKRTVYSPYNMSERVPSTSSATTLASGVVTPTSSTPRASMETQLVNGGLTIPTPLIIDCPLDRMASLSEDYNMGTKKAVIPLSAPPSVPPFARDNASITDDEDPVDHRPRSIPSILSACHIPSVVEHTGTGISRLAQSSVGNLFTECAIQSTLDKLAATLSNPSSDCLQNLPTTTASSPFDSMKNLDYSQLSSLMRTLTASGLTANPTDTVSSTSQPQQITNSLFADVNSKLSGLVSFSRDDGVRWNSGKSIETLADSESFDLDAVPRGSNGVANVTPRSVAISYANQRSGSARLNCLIRPRLANELDSEMNGNRPTELPNRSLQLNECLSSPLEKTAPRQSFKMKKWFSTTEPSSRCLVTESCTTSSNPSTFGVADCAGTLFHNSQSTQQRMEFITNTSAFHRSQSEPCNPIANGDVTWSCQPPPTTPTTSSSTDPGAQILMMLSPSEQDKRTSTTLDPALSHALQAGLTGKSSKKFPLLLVSASSSASAAALAAAAAMATGAPPTSLVPVPVQVRTYVSSEADRLSAERSPDSLQSTRSGVHYQNDREDGFATTTPQRLVLSFCPADNEKNNTNSTTPLERKLSLLLSAPPMALPNSNTNVQNGQRSYTKSIIEPNLSLASDATHLSLLQPTAIAHIN
ncbi:unnamed protein product [Echinostoma caproni]|uniref:PH domain-containing protein n=1 Tax=Echinostoma caproni TaxID=27848 RepID=A0A183ANC0_9TREM|nr:unnamed protein product [Echinostoma caproni]